MGEVIEMKGRREPAGNLTCVCGSQWFDAHVVIDMDRSVAGYAVGTVTCLDCGRDLFHNDGSLA